MLLRKVVVAGYGTGNILGVLAYAPFLVQFGNSKYWVIILLKIE
jgi:hypothetical protein